MQDTTRKDCNLVVWASNLIMAWDELSHRTLMSTSSDCLLTAYTVHKDSPPRIYFSSCEEIGEKSVTWY